MGGFTQIFLKDTSEENIAKHNAKLEIHKVPKKYRFASENDTFVQYEYFKANLGHFPEHLFPKDKIKSFNDFKRYWSPSALGEVFVPYAGTLQFDCYFGRTSKRAMKNIARYLVENYRDISKTSGSFSIFIERSFNKLEAQIWEESGVPNR